MLPPLSLGDLPACEIDWGGFDLRDLDEKREEALLILKRIDVGKRAREASDLLAQRIAAKQRPRSIQQQQQEFDKLTSASRYSPADSEIDLSWYPLWCFLGFVEYLSYQYLTALIMSRKATHQALGLVWSEPLNMKVFERYNAYLSKQNPSWAQNFQDEARKFKDTSLSRTHSKAYAGPPSEALSVAPPHQLDSSGAFSLGHVHDTMNPPPQQLHLSTNISVNTLLVGGSRKWTRTSAIMMASPTGQVQLGSIVRSPTLGERSLSSLTRPDPTTDHTSRAMDHNEAGEAFQWVRTEFRLAATLLEISTIWGGIDIPRMMFDRIVFPRKRWNTQGEIEEAMLDSDIGAEFAHSTDAINYLRSSGLVISKPNEDGYERLTIIPVLHRYLELHIPDPEQSRAKALIIMCHLFPGDKDIEPFHHKDLGRLQLRPLQSVAKYIIDFATKDLLSTQQQYNIIEILLESSKFPDPTTGSAWQFQALEIAESMLAKSPEDAKLEDLQMLAAIRRKALSRLVLGKVFDEPNLLVQRRPKSPRSNALHWELRLSRAQDCVQRDDFYGAEREICDYAAFYPARTSTKEHRLGKRVRFDRARFLYLAGRFEKAQPLLEQELKALRHDEKLDDSLICFLAGVHCELSNPQEALRLTQSTITGSRDRGARNRLGVLLAEVHLHLGLSSCTFGPTPSMDESARASFNKAKTICERAINSYESIPNFDQSGPVDSVAKVDRMGYLRVVTIIARISFLEAIFDNGDLSQARCMWINVLEAAKKCGWEKPGFMEGNSHYTIGAIEICFDQIDASKRDIEYARTLLTEAGLRNTFIGLGPIWFELVGYVISMRGGSRINLPDQYS